MAESLSLPACPHCGCKRSEIVTVRETFGRHSEYRQCSSPRCRRHFSVEPTVTYDSDPIRIVCPNCYTKNPGTTRTVQKLGEDGRPAATVRYHHCDACSYTFKSVEQHG